MNFLKFCKNDKEIMLYKVIIQQVSLNEYIDRFHVTATTARRQVKVMRQYFQYLNSQNKLKKIA